MKRLTVFTAASLGINLAWAVANAAMGFVWFSWWFVTMGVYYALLSIMRFALLQIKHRADKNIADENFAKKFTGVMLVITAVCLAGVVILTVVQGHGTDFGEIAMIAIATYTFTKITMAIINIAKAGRIPSPVVKTLRNISLADSFVSIYSLQRSMLVTFEGMTAQNIRLFNILTGSAVCLLVLLLGINLIGGKRTEMAKSKIINTVEKISETVTDGYKKIENTVTDGYKKVEETVVGGYKSIEDKFVENYLTKDGETVEQAKERLKKGE